MNEPTKREQRQEKRLLKRAGGKRRRRDLKLGLAVDPDEAPFTEAGFGKCSTAGLNGIDHDPTRARTGAEA